MLSANLLEKGTWGSSKGLYDKIESIAGHFSIMHLRALQPHAALNGMRQ